MRARVNMGDGRGRACESGHKHIIISNHAPAHHSYRTFGMFVVPARLFNFCTPMIVI